MYIYIIYMAVFKFTACMSCQNNGLSLEGTSIPFLIPRRLGSGMVGAGGRGRVGAEGDSVQLTRVLWSKEAFGVPPIRRLKLVTGCRKRCWPACTSDTVGSARRILVPGCHSRYFYQYESQIQEYWTCMCRCAFAKSPEAVQYQVLVVSLHT